jgi:1,4-dihydroxy-6-naphthoate synthase
MHIEFAFSPCPNDTFIVHALLHNAIDTKPFSFTPFIDDVETLNQAALAARFQLTKLSFFAYLHVQDRYELLDAGAALGFGCGPLIVAKRHDISFANAKVALPGGYTTARLLFRLRHPEATNMELARFDEILPGIQSGRFDAGVIIHEGRFIYPEYDCVQLADLGEWWEKETGLPLPLGCMALRKDPALMEAKADIERLIRASIEYGWERREASRDFIKAHSQELDDKVIDSHIGLYVNDFSLSLGKTGRLALSTMEEMARLRGIL